MKTLNEQAQLAANRVDATAVGLDPFTILTIVTQVLPILTSCWNKNDEPNPELSARNLKRYNDAHPKQLLKRTARRIRAEATEPMTKEQSFALAEAVIAQALEAAPETVKVCCMEAPQAE